ncbi:MAG TPA: prephenate dehydrogenase/arogenate dehydrogenase family protein [bacterium]|nr:prephenate dehydrogenase/arogenate dehydrogenase family protein [bacterium]
MGFGTVGILGVGLLGGSLGMALKSAYLAERIIGIGRNQQRLQLALECGAVDEVSLNVSCVAPVLDLLVIATPVDRIASFVQESAEKLKPGAVITDVGSTKAKVVAQSESSIGRDDVFFVGSHPMAGGEKTGVQAARKDLFEGATCFVTPSPSTNPGARDQVCQLWRSVGGNVHLVSPEEHDALVAASSHLPHLIASALCLSAERSAENHAMLSKALGAGFKDTTRIAAGSEDLWRDICMHNRNNLLDCFEQFSLILEEIRIALGTNQEERLEALLRRAREFRENL